MRLSLKLPDWVIGFAVTLFFLFVALTGTLDFTAAIEQKSVDFRNRLTAPKERHPDIELVVFTDNNISDMGAHSCPRDMLARCIRNLSLAGAKVIALDVVLGARQEFPELRAVRNLLQSYGRSGLAQQGAGLAFYKELSEAQAELDNDSNLYNAVEKAGNVLLPLQFDLESNRRDSQIPSFFAKHAFRSVKGSTKEHAGSAVKRASRLRPLLPTFAEVAAGMGHLNFFPDQDGVLRSQFHVLGYTNETYFPSFALAIVKAFKNLKIENISVVLGKGINLKLNPSSVTRVPVFAPQMRTLIRWREGPAVSFHQTPMSKVLKNEFEVDLFKDKIVIVGTAARVTGDRFVTPLSRNLPVAEVVANSAANILDHRFALRRPWMSNVEFAVIVLFGSFITLILPRLNTPAGAITTLGLLVAYGTVSTVLLSTSNLLLKTASPMLLLVFGCLLLFSKRFLAPPKSKENRPNAFSDPDNMPSVSSQKNDPLNLALEKLRQLPRGDEKIKDLFYDIGLVYEQNRDLTSALALYELILNADSNFKDLNRRVQKLRAIDSSFARGSSEADHFDRFRGDKAQRPVLTHYELIRELGRGSASVVYKAREAGTHRVVAIKALDFSQFDRDTASEFKARFLRAAESTGLLTHPNIVPIYDFGEEKDLVYVAMEYLKGSNLGLYTRADHLLPLGETLNVVAQVADALEYAHAKGVLHGSIKPANIIWSRKTKKAKVTDFTTTGLASFSKNRRGIGIDFPCYMSPEQLSGKKLDGRSDIFSVGALLFELLTGQKPFAGDDISALMLMIARDKHPSAKALNARVPLMVESIIDRALEKDMQKRYETAGQLARRLKEVIVRIDEILAQKMPGSSSRERNTA